MNPFRILSALFARRALIEAANDEQQTIVAFNAVAGSGDAVVIDANNEKRTARLFVPFGEYGPVTGLDRRDGKNKPTTQVFDLEAANAIIAGLNTLRGKVARKLRMIPVYVGHPDVAGMEAIYPDRSAKGWIVGANIGKHEERDGLFFDAEMTPAGMKLIGDEEFVFNSPRWGMVPMTAANERVQRARPSQIISAALTNTPMIPGSLAIANEDMPAVAQEQSPFVEISTIATLLGLTPDSPLSKVLAEISRLFDIATQLAKGSRLVDEATWRASETAAGELVSANTALAAAVATAETEKALALAATTKLADIEGQIVAANTQLQQTTAARDQVAAQIEAANTAAVQAREETARVTASLEAANTALAASRHAHAALVVDLAIEEGRVIPADRDTRVNEIVAANCAETAIARVRSAPVVVKVRSELGGIGGRKPGREANASLVSQAAEEARRTGGDMTEIYLRLSSRA